MKIKFENSSDYLNSLNIMVYAIVGLPLLLFIILYIGQKDGKIEAVLTGDIIQTINYVLLVCIFAFLLIGYFMYNKQKKIAQLKEDLRSKMNALAQATVNKFLWFFVSSSLSILGMYLTGEKFYSGVFVFVLIFISISNPSPYRILRDLKLNKEDGQKVLKKELID